MNNLIKVLMIAAILISGCSSAGTPTIPDDSNEALIPGFAQPSNINNATGLFGVYELGIDPLTSTAELISKRNSTIGESYIINGISYFTISPCTDCLKIKSITLTNEGFIQLTFAIHHPFEPGDPFKPPTCVNRLDLDVFDVVMLVQPLETIADAYSLTDASVYSGIVINNAGYTTELANAIDETAALPFVLVIDDNAAGTDTFNKFEMDAETEFDVLFNIEDTLRFTLYLTMGYGWSAIKSEQLLPTYYNPEFNKKGAWKVVVTPPHGENPPDMTNTWNAGDNTTEFDITVKVFDWQIGANVNPELTEQTDIYAASGVSAVTVEIPGMNSALPTVNTADSGAGTPDDPLVYTLSVANENLLPEGEYSGLVKVSDERIPGVVLFGAETDTMVDSPDGTIINWTPIPEFATYQTFTAIVVLAVGLPVGNVILKVKRLNGSLQKYVLNEDGPFTLEWEEPTGGHEEYAIYIDTDPSDGLDNDFNFIGTSTGFTFTDSVTPVPADHYIAGWTYIVRGRSQVGNPLSESDDSELAHVMFNGWETQSNHSNPGIMNDGEGWLVNHETMSGAGVAGLNFPRACSDTWFYHAQGDTSCQFSPWCGDGQYATLAGHWNGILKETPAVPDSSVRFVDFSIFYYQTLYDQEGLSLGTSPSHVFEAYDCGLFEWVYSESGGFYVPYNFDSDEVQTGFGDVPDGINNCWRAARYSNNTNYELYGGDCNNGGNPDDPYVGIEFIRITTIDDFWQPYIFIDEVAVAIY